MTQGDLRVHPDFERTRFDLIKEVVLRRDALLEKIHGRCLEVIDSFRRQQGSKALREA